jgi:lysophospholipase L1-like esterase
MELFSFTYIKLKSKKGTYRDRVKPVANPYHPYLGYVHSPNYTFSITKKTLSRKMSLVTDENGYSITPSFSYADPDLTIVVTGGSTIFGVGSSDNSSTVPSILERIINQRLNIRTEVVNLALRGGTSFQEMLLVNRFFAEIQADLVLAITGRNDAAFAFYDPTVEGAFLQKRVWDNAVSLVHRAEKGEFMVLNLVHKLRYWSYTYDFLYRQIKHRSNPEPFEFTLAAPSKLNLRREVPTDTKQRTKITATHFAAADQISKMNGASFVMFLQPTLFNKYTWTEEEIRRLKMYKWSDEALKERQQYENEFYDAFRETKKPFQFIDLSNIFSHSNETLYIDIAHYNDLAAEKFAEKIFESIQPLLLKLKDR